MSVSQNKLILYYLQNGNSITPLEALQKFNCFRLGARISDLKQEGHNIKTTIIHREGKHYASYKIEKAQESHSVPEVVSESGEVMERMRFVKRWGRLPGGEKLPPNPDRTQFDSADRSLHNQERQELLF